MSVEEPGVGNGLVPRAGRVIVISDAPGVAVLDAVGVPIVSIDEFLNSLSACGASSGTVLSYAQALLRWWRFLAAVGVSWARADRVVVRDFVVWMRSAAATPRGEYAPATINHNLAVLASFYDDRLAAGDGPMLNPVPAATGRDGQRPWAHHNPMHPAPSFRRAPLRQKVPMVTGRGVPDGLFDELFTAMTGDRDRALLAFYVSTGARASELLGVTFNHVDPGRQLIGVHRKGSGRLQWLPASPDAFVWLRRYQVGQTRPDGEQALWLTRRAPHRPLTYPAMRRVMQRANDRLGTTWTLHDLRHTAARRMIADPKLSLVDVQWVLGHAHLTTTEVYLRPTDDEVIARVLAHHDHAGDTTPTAPARTSRYRPETLAALLGEGLL